MEQERIYDEFRDLIRRCLQDAVEMGNIEMGQIDAYDKLIDMDKDLQEIVMNERIGEYYEDEYSRNSYGGGSYRGNSYRGGGSYRTGGSYRGGNGGYSRNNSYRGYSREGGREEMMEKMHMMMDNASTEQEREAIRKVLETL